MFKLLRPDFSTGDWISCVSQMTLQLSASQLPQMTITQLPQFPGLSQDVWMIPGKHSDNTGVFCIYSHRRERKMEHVTRTGLSFSTYSLCMVWKHRWSGQAGKDQRGKVLVKRQIICKITSALSTCIWELSMSFPHLCLKELNLWSFKDFLHWTGNKTELCNLHLS